MERARRESECDAGAAGSPEQTDHPWNDLTTITTFDQGDNMRSTFCLNNIDENQNSGKIMPAGKSRKPQLTQATVLIESLLQQLCAILEGDKVRREKLYYAICKKLHDLQLINDTYDTMEFETLKGKYQRAFCQMLSVARGQPESDSVMFMPKFLIPKLRYHEEFQEISFIARGGFGEVYKARHRLDGIEYAIKKITMPTDRIEIIQKQLNEVRALAKLNHTNIVSYNAAWIESSSYNSSSVPPPDRKSYRSHTSKRHRKESKSYKSLIEDLFNSKKDVKTKKRSKIYGNIDDSDTNHDTISKRFEELDSSADITEERIIEKSNEEESTEESSSDVVSFRNSKSNENLDQTIIDTDTSGSYSVEESSSRDVCTYDKSRPYVTLYIQMALCEQTLEQWLRGRINVTPEPLARAIFQQILCGVDYMHSQKIVHHDIKPSNIFISTSGRLQIQLGDFGLACPLQIGNHHSVVGTHMYAAPEQLKGNCDPKSDVYSIGIVLVELLISIKTQMELSTIISCLKSGNVPEDLKRHKWAQIVKQLVQENPVKRPSTSQLLQNFNNDKDVIINGLKDTIVNLKNDNRIKDDTIQKLVLEIVLLKEEVQKLSIQQIVNNTTN
ncbi:eukaryotic translation initiation factor 2-alpha kinase 1-like isoform X2 [Temnothorax curvispinosus]|nr:eukaryotic translation initiation factor 2-alpha kinase 1-like isoform X2 [Temnothorax curvispinosus]XP_024882772.1 eukaryotic translation initiation factor 2-alpha kinase 1-like isoform X2 [Temnothorax curvispinosus]